MGPGSVSSASSVVVTQQPAANTRPSSGLSGSLTSVDNSHSKFEIGLLNRVNACPEVAPGLAGALVGCGFGAFALVPALSTAAASIIGLSGVGVSVGVTGMVKGAIARATEKLSLDTVEQTVGGLKASWDGEIKGALASLDLEPTEVDAKLKNAKVYASVFALSNGLDLAAAHANKLTLPIIGSKVLAKEARDMQADVRAERINLQTANVSRQLGSFKTVFPRGGEGSVESLPKPLPAVDEAIADLKRAEVCLAQIATKVDSGTPGSVERTIVNDGLRSIRSYQVALLASEGRSVSLDQGALLDRETRL